MLDADGQLDLMVFSNLSAPGRVRALVSLLAGSHERSPGVESIRAARVRLVFASPPAYEVDGEWRRAQSPELEVSVVPQRLRVLTAGG